MTIKSFAEYITDEYFNSDYPMVQEIISMLSKKYGEPDCGRNRCTFKSKNFVFKVPRNYDGIDDNQYESSVRFKPDWTDYASAKIVLIKNFPVLLMVKVDINVDSDKLPSWVKFIDGNQVGYNKKGKIQVYDFGVR